MNSRESIIGNIRKLGLKERSLPDLPQFARPGDLLAQYRESLAANHAQLVECPSEADLKGELERLAGKYVSVVCNWGNYSLSTLDPGTISHPSELRQVELAIVEAELGVAENGAHWLPEEKLGIRALPFIVLHLAVVVRKSTLVANMHEAYAKIRTMPGFGTFIAGPSKTADIEQALVIGAHGPKSLTVVLVS